MGLSLIEIILEIILYTRLHNYVGPKPSNLYELLALGIRDIKLELVLLGTFVDGLTSSTTLNKYFPIKSKNSK
jgi:hypothetical protein